MLIVSTPMLRLFYQRWGYDYQIEIRKHLENRGLSLKLKRRPNASDWDTAPFPKPPFIKVSMGTIKFLGFTTSLTDTSYWIIETEQNVNIWLEVETTFLRKPNLKLKEEKQPVPPRSIEELAGQSTFNCPGCQYPVVISDEICPDCGLNFNA